MPDRPTPGTLEQRNAPESATPTLDGRRLRGAIPYGVESRDLGGWREVMEPGCMNGARLEDLVATVDHAGVPLGRHPRTLEVEDRADALHWSVELPESRADVREAVEREDLRSCSWRMVVARDEWRGNVRHVHEVAELRDVSVVTNPAYAEARAEFRAAPDPDNPPAETRAPDEEATVPETITPPGGLRVEDRAATPPAANVEERVLDAMRAVYRGEARSLTEADGSAGPVTPEDIRNVIWDRLRDAAVMLAAGCPVLTTESKKVKWPRIVGDMSADFYNELEEITPSDPDFDEYEVDPKAIKALVRGSSEAFEDSDPDLLRTLQSHLDTILSLKLDRELLVGNAAKGFKGLTNATGTTTIDAAGSMQNYDLMLRAAGAIVGNHANAPLVSVTHPWVATAMSLWKEETGSNKPLMRPEGVPPTYLTSQIGRNNTAGTSTVLIFPPSLVPVVRRRDVTVEVDRSQEFSADAVLVRGKLRASLFLPHPEVVVKIINVPAPDPTVIA